MRWVHAAQAARAACQPPSSSCLSSIRLRRPLLLPLLLTFLLRTRARVLLHNLSERGYIGSFRGPANKYWFCADAALALCSGAILVPRNGCRCGTSRCFVTWVEIHGFSGQDSCNWTVTIYSSSLATWRNWSLHDPPELTALRRRQMRYTLRKENSSHVLIKHFLMETLYR